jgi:catechol-2,3-dioxygenase
MTTQSETGIRVARLNHAVLYVSSVDQSVEFYRKAFAFEEVARAGGVMAFLRATGGDNHHDLGLFEVGWGSAPPGRSVGLYHLAWEVPTIEDLAAGATVLAELDALTGMSDHGATKSLYGKDPDGIEFEVMWMVPREEWGEHERQAGTWPLDMQREVARWGGRG